MLFISSNYKLQKKAKHIKLAEANLVNYASEEFRDTKVQRVSLRVQSNIGGCHKTVNLTLYKQGDYMRRCLYKFSFSSKSYNPIKGEMIQSYYYQAREIEGRRVPRDRRKVP